MLLSLDILYTTSCSSVFWLSLLTTVHGFFFAKEYNTILDPPKPLLSVLKDFDVKNDGGTYSYKYNIYSYVTRCYVGYR